MTIKQVIRIIVATPLLVAGLCCKQPKSNKSADLLQKTEVEVLSLLALSDSTARLTLRSTKDTVDKLAMDIGHYEAQMLAIAIENFKPVAPLPLDLLQEAITKFGYKVEQIIIDTLIDGVYSARIVCSSQKNAIVELKARPSDAVTLAFKVSSPIYVNSAFLKDSTYER